MESCSGLGQAQDQAKMETDSHKVNLLNGLHRMGIFALLLCGGVDTSTLTNDKQKNLTMQQIFNTFL